MVQDLWAVFDALAFCRARYNLTSSSLSVLRALISFVPKAEDDSHCRLIVWPSNQVLAERANGMDERTLRRHLRRLCDAGLIERRASSNGKRFALRLKKTVVNAYGLDLSPLLARESEILAAADAQHLQNEEIRVLRTDILNLLFAMQQVSQGTVALEDEVEIRRMLRRNPDLSTLLATKTLLVEKQPASPPQAEVLTASSSQNDRHLQKTDKDTYVSVNDDHHAKNPVNIPTVHKESNETETITLSDCLEAVRESIAFAPSPIQTWADLVRLADTLAPMIGIGPELMAHSRRAMGDLPAAISVLCLIQPKSHILRPAAYLRKLSLLAERGLYSLKSLVRSARKQQFAAVNHGMAIG